MANYKKKNNAKSTLVYSITDSVNNLFVLDPTKFPTSPEFVLTIWNKNVYLNPSDDPNMEIVKITSITSGNHFFITRAQEGTSAHSHSAGDNIEMLITAGQVVDSQKNLLKTNGAVDTPIISDGIQVDDLQSDKALITNATNVLGYPSTTVLAEETLAYTAFYEIASQQDVLGHYKEITFSTPVSVIKGQRYAIVFEITITNDNDNFYSVGNHYGQIAGKEYALDFGYYYGGSFGGNAYLNYYEMSGIIYIDDVADYDLKTNIIGDYSLATNYNNWIWQSFVAGATGDLTKINVNIGRKGNPGSLKIQVRPLATETKAISRTDLSIVGDNLIKSKCSDSLFLNKTILSTNHPETHKGCFGNVIATATLTPSDVTTSYAEYDVIFDTPAQVYKGWRYAIHCRVDNATMESGRYFIQGYNGAVDQYTDGYQYMFQEYYPNIYQDIQTDFSTYGEFWFKTYLSDVEDVSVTPTLNSDYDVYWLQGSLRDRISMGQTFIPLNSGNLNKVRLKIRKHPSFTPTFNLIIEIREWIENKENITPNGFFNNLPIMLGSRVGNNLTVKDIEEGVEKTKYLYDNKHTRNTDTKLQVAIPYISDVPSSTVLVTETITGLSGFGNKVLTFSSPASVVAGRKYALVFRAPTGLYYFYKGASVYADGQISESANLGVTWTQPGQDFYSAFKTYVANVLDISYTGGYAASFMVNGSNYIATSIKPTLSGLLNKIEVTINAVSAGTGLIMELRDVTPVVSDLIDNADIKENITVQSGKTIDGRDLSADGSKLDNIEENAVALATVKADVDIDDAIDKKHEHLDQHLNLGTGELKVKVFAQATEPTLNADDYIAIWKDTSVSGLPNVYLVFRRGTADQVKVLFNV